MTVQIISQWGTNDIIEVNLHNVTKFQVNRMQNTEGLTTMDFLFDNPEAKKEALKKLANERFRVNKKYDHNLIFITAWFPKDSLITVEY